MATKLLTLVAELNVPMHPVLAVNIMPKTVLRHVLLIIGLQVASSLHNGSAFGTIVDFQLAVEVSIDVHFNRNVCFSSKKGIKE